MSKREKKKTEARSLISAAGAEQGAGVNDDITNLSRDDAIRLLLEERRQNQSLTAVNQSQALEIESQAHIIDEEPNTRRRVSVQAVHDGAKATFSALFPNNVNVPEYFVNATKRNQAQKNFMEESGAFEFNITSCCWLNFENLVPYTGGTEDALAQPFIEKLLKHCVSKEYENRIQGLSFKFRKGIVRGLLPDVQIKSAGKVVGIIEVKSLNLDIDATDIIEGDTRITSTSGKVKALGQLADYMETAFDNQDKQGSIAGFLTNMKSCIILILSYDADTRKYVWKYYRPEVNGGPNFGSFEESEQMFFNFLHYLEPEKRPNITTRTRRIYHNDNDDDDFNSDDRHDDDSGPDDKSRATPKKKTAAQAKTTKSSASKVKGRKKHGLEHDEIVEARDPSLFVNVRVNFKELLGEGRESKVYGCVGEEFSNSVMKIFNASGPAAVRTMRTEIAFMKMLTKYRHLSHCEHYYGIPAYAIRISPRGDTINGMSQDQLNLGQFRRLAKDLMAMHEEQKIVNWDIKHSNIILDKDDELVLIDWSHAMYIGECLLNADGYGTWGYHNPARFNPNCGFSLQCCLPHDDLYALFVVVSSIFPDKSAVFKATMELISSESNEDLTFSQHLRESVLSALTDGTMANQ